MATSTSNIEQLAINTIRTLSMDAVQAANSGHPGTPMALAPVAYLLFNEVLRYDPAQPGLAGPRPVRALLRPCLDAALLDAAPGRRQATRRRRPADRRAGRLAGRHPPVPPVRQPLPGPSRVSATPSGVETTTGPLGQGVANSVGMAIAARWLAAHYNRPGFELFDFNVYALCSDGDLMEGVGGEAASLAGHLKLSNLCWIYDDNQITIEGDTVAGLQRRRGRAVRRLRLERASRSTTSTTWTRCGRRSASFQEDRRPAHADHRPQRHRLGRPQRGQDTPRRPRRPAGRGGDPADQGRPTAGPRTSSSSCPTEVLDHFRDGHRRRGAAGCARPGTRSSPSTRQKYPELADAARADLRAASCPRAGTPTSPSFPPTPRAWPAGPPPARCSTRWPRTSPGCSAARPTWPRRTSRT